MSLSKEERESWLRRKVKSIHSGNDCQLVEIDDDEGLFVCGHYFGNNLNSVEIDNHLWALKQFLQHFLDDKDAEIETHEELEQGLGASLHAAEDEIEKLKTEVEAIWRRVHCG